VDGSACNPSYSGDKEDCSFNPVLDKLFRRPYLKKKTPPHKRAGRMAQVVKVLIRRHEVLSSTPISIQKNHGK
jgi:hypothetical protein